MFRIADTSESVFKCSQTKHRFTSSLATSHRHFYVEVPRIGIEAANFEARTSVDLEALEQALSVVKNKNVDYIQQIQKQEVKPFFGTIDQSYSSKKIPCLLLTTKNY